MQAPANRQPRPLAGGELSRLLVSYLYRRRVPHAMNKKWKWKSVHFEVLFSSNLKIYC